LTSRLDFPKSGWHALVYGWKLHVVSVVAAVWFPIAAVLTPANVAVSPPAPNLLREVPADVRFVLGDLHYNIPDLHENCDQADRLLVTTKYGSSPHSDDGVQVRRLFHTLCSIAMEHLHEHFKGIFDGHGQVPDLWLGRYPTLCGWRTICVSQLAFLYRFEHDLELCVGLKAFRKRGLMMDDQVSPQSLLMCFPTGVAWISPICNPPTLKAAHRFPLILAKRMCSRG
jgi:hypothetical protein